MTMNLPHDISAPTAGSFLPFLSGPWLAADRLSTLRFGAMMRDYFGGPVAGGAVVLNQQAHFFQYLDYSSNRITPAYWDLSVYLYT
jgi:hypothetical protein